MAKKKQVLGRGLSALLSDSKSKIESAKEEGASDLVGNVLEIPIEKIKTNPYQPRTHFDKSALEDLAQSIKELGVIQPITVRKNKNNFELISGERRLRASSLAKLETIPAYIRLADDQEMLEMALVENIQRQELDAIEIALSYRRLLDEIRLTQEELSQRVGKNRSTISNYLRLLNLKPVIQTAIRDGEISMGHGKAIISLDETKQLSAYKTILSQSLSVRNTEKLIQQLNNKSSSDPKPTENIIEIPEKFIEVRRSLSEKLNTRIDLKRDNKGKGKLIVHFESDADFNRLKKLLKND